MDDSSAMSVSMSMTATATSGAMATATNMTMSMGGGCKISMLWNWYTVDACFISSTWRITSTGMFAGSCVGVVLLVMSLELLRRAGREYDAHIRRIDFARRNSEDRGLIQESTDQGSAKQPAVTSIQRGRSAYPRTSRFVLIGRQVVRSLIHMVAFGVAYFVMLLAMYYNGYFIICILIGAFLGAFTFSWDQLASGEQNQPTDVTGCCG